jgi:hypothetical protein
LLGFARDDEVRFTLPLGGTITIAETRRSHLTRCRVAPKALSRVPGTGADDGDTAHAIEQ